MSAPGRSSPPLRHRGARAARCGAAGRRAGHGPRRVAAHAGRVGRRVGDPRGRGRRRSGAWTCDPATWWWPTRYAPAAAPCRSRRRRCSPPRCAGVGAARARRADASRRRGRDRRDAGELAATGALAVDTRVGRDGRARGRQAVRRRACRSSTPPSAAGRPGDAGRRMARRCGPCAQPLRRCDEWADAVGSREVTLASPRSFCAGVERAIDIVDRALDRYGAPVYVRRQIVHNAHVVREPARTAGAVFVDEVDEVPDGSRAGARRARCRAGGP